VELLPFKNEKLTDFTIDENKEAMMQALEGVLASFGTEYPLIIGGKEYTSEHIIESRNPANPDEVVGVVYGGDKHIANEAIENAYEAFEEWSWISGEKRAMYLLKAASILRKRKHEISSTMVYEAGKSWAEADADTAEAIDFLEYYARSAISYSKDQEVCPYPDEVSSYRYIPLGVGAIITPWNFPAAILTGMTSAAIVTGNTAVLKPASDTPVVGAKLANILYECGLPPGVLNFVPGPGNTVGEQLVKHSLTRFISFTGSMKIGKRIYEMASVVWEGQKWLKRVVTEMGGKNALIIDDPCDIDAAVKATVASAFGYQGQKCSACSRAIVVESVYNSYMKELLDAVGKITVGPTNTYENYMGPVSSKEAFDKILHYIDIGKKEATLAHGGNSVKGVGYFIEPTIFVDVDPMARIAQEEIFGPVLSIIKSKDFNDALAIANYTAYGLTGGIFSNNRRHIERAKKEFYVGNFYINRKITGALVGVQPFGGYNMSGTCSKAGGPEYLQLFMQTKSMVERL